MLGPTFAPGAVLGDRYRIDEVIGRGGYGAVFRATQLNLKRAVAIKVVLPELAKRDGMERFEQEAALAQRLEHPNTVRIFDYGRAPDGAPYLVLELLRGRSLEAALQAGERFDARRAARIGEQMLKALMEAHKLGIIHRDIKPANVFLCDFEGEPDFVKLLDFGIAKTPDARRLTRQGEVVGTPAYMAPEQVTARPLGPGTDLYAVGLVMAEMLAGRPVYGPVQWAQLAQEIASEHPTPLAEEALGTALGPILQRATQKDPERRYASAAEMLAQVAAVVAAPGATPLAQQVTAEHSAVTPDAPLAPAPPPRSVPDPLVPAAIPPTNNAPVLSPPRPLRSVLQILAAVILTAGVVGALAVFLFVRFYRRASPPAAPAAPITWISGADQEVFEASINEAGSPDFVTFCGLPAPHLCGIDGSTFGVIWKTPVVGDEHTMSNAHLTIVGRTAVMVDGTATMHFFDVRTGQEQRTALRLQRRAEIVCAPHAHPGTVWIRMEGGSSLRIDVATHTTVPGSGGDRSTPPPCRNVLGASGSPAIDQVRPEIVLVDGSDGVVLGSMENNAQAIMLQGFTPPLRPTGAVRWTRHVPPDNGRGGTGPAQPLVDLAGGRAVTYYKHGGGAEHVIGVNLGSGKNVWDVKHEGTIITLLRLTKTRVYVGDARRIEVREAATGKLLGGLGPP